jgi:hypothetical protein
MTTTQLIEVAGGGGYREKDAFKFLIISSFLLSSAYLIFWKPVDFSLTAAQKIFILNLESFLCFSICEIATWIGSIDIVTPC